MSKQGENRKGSDQASDLLKREEAGPQGFSGSTLPKTEEQDRDVLDWLLIGGIALLIGLIVFFLWPRGKEGRQGQPPLPGRKVAPGTPNYKAAYDLGVDHLGRGEYGQAVLDLEDSVKIKKDYRPAQEKLAEARSLADLDSRVRRGQLSDEAAGLREPVEFLPGDAERKGYELEGVSVRKAIEGGSTGSKLAWWGEVVAVAGEGFVVENRKLKEAFFVRSGTAPSLGSSVKVYGVVAGLLEWTPGAATPFKVPAVDPRIIDPAN